jgi:integrase
MHAFRHGRVSVLQAMGIPGDLVKEWVGHSNLHTTSRYTHFQDDFRRQTASQVALFQQPNLLGKLDDGPNGPRFPQLAASA